MKFTAFMTITIANIVIVMLSQLDTTMRSPNGRERICRPPPTVMMPAARNCAPSLIIQSMSQRSSMTPITAMRRAAARMDHMVCGGVQMLWKKGLAAEIAKAATMPKKIATPPRRGVGVVCTSRSRMPGYSLKRRLNRHTAHVSTKVIAAVTMIVKRYCFTNPRPAAPARADRPGPRAAALSSPRRPAGPGPRPARRRRRGGRARWRR